MHRGGGKSPLGREKKLAGIKLTYPIVPDSDGVSLPAEPNEQIRVLVDLSKQQPQDSVGLSLGDANDTACETLMCQQMSTRRLVVQLRVGKKWMWK